jgi:hypothetical protein
VILECVQDTTIHRQPPADLGVARHGLRLVVAIEVKRLRPERARKHRYQFARRSVQHVQASAHPDQGLAKFGDAVPDELDPAVRRFRQPVQDIGVEDEYAMDAARLFKRVVQRRVVMAAQVTAEPDQRGVVELHRLRRAQPAMRRNRRTPGPSTGSFAYNSSAVSQ